MEVIHTDVLVAASFPAAAYNTGQTIHVDGGESMI